MLWNSQDDKVAFMGNMVRTLKIIEEDFGAKQAKFGAKQAKFQEWLKQLIY